MRIRIGWGGCVWGMGTRAVGGVGRDESRRRRGLAGLGDIFFPFFFFFFFMCVVAYGGSEFGVFLVRGCVMSACVSVCYACKQRLS